VDKDQIENQQISQIDIIEAPLERQSALTELPQLQVSIRNNSRKSRILHFLVTIILALIVSILVIVKFLQKAPDVKAQEYLQAVAGDLKDITYKIDYFKGSFIEVSKSLQTSKGAFYEIITPRDYFSALEDTKQDVIDISSTLDLIHKAQETREQLEVPEELESFDTKLNEYYHKSEESLNLLYSFERFQMTMLEASGVNLNNKLKELDNLVKNNVSDKEKWTEILSDLVDLSNEASFRFDNIKDIPETELDYYELMKGYHNDLSETMKKLHGYLLSNTTEDDENFIVEIMNFSQRNVERDNARQRLTEEKIEKSKIKELLVEIDSLEKIILEEFGALADEYKVEFEITP